MSNSPAHSSLSFPRIRQLMVDGGRLGTRKHTVHGLVEFDVTEARTLIRDHRSRTGEALSFSAFFLNCLGEAIESNKFMHAYRDWRNRLILFENVDVNMLFEVEVQGKKTIRPHILRGVNKKSMRDLHDEIRAFQKGHMESRESRLIDWFVRLPAVMRRIALWSLFKSPQLIKDYYGTVLVSSIGMFGTGGGWAIPVPNHTLQITLGGINEKPTVINHQIEPREIMSVTVSFDHDLVDGAPAARFIQRLKEMVESGYSLVD